MNLGEHLFVNGHILWKDGLLYVPKQTTLPMPLLIWLHGGGGDAVSNRYLFSIAEEMGVVIAAVDARHNTWDGIDSPFGPDVVFIEKTLSYVLEHVNIDRNRIALGGLSDGASYSLALGRSNGDVFTHLIAAAPWYLTVPSEENGKPKILVIHGTRDNIYPAQNSRHVLVPWLKKQGYSVDYLEFVGPHWVPESVATEMLHWLKTR